MALLEEDLAGKTLIYSTTNGTVAVGKARGADHVYAAALLNGEAMVAQIERAHAGDTVLIVCSGSADNFNLEDFYGAGYLVSLFARRPGAHELTDAAMAARLLHDHCEAMECLSASRVGRMMLSRGLDHEVGFAAQKSRFPVVARLEDGALRTLARRG
jgi:2-phosphosulfolactate phosphatase